MQVSSETQPHASSSKWTNPQLGPEPYFAYPTPTSIQIEDELPPYYESESIPLGQLLDRISRKGYGDLRTLLEQTLPPIPPRQKPRHIIEYARTTRQAILKYLAVLRWHASVDVPGIAPLPSPQVTTVASFPTPHSLDGSNTTSPAAYPGKGKGRMPEEDEKPNIRGRIADARRIQTLMEHQNRQHDDAVAHVKHTAKIVEGLRLRNPDILTALSLLTLGTYPRLPSGLTESFIPRKPLTNAVILDTLRRLNAHIKYRLRCVDYLPPDVVLERIADGRAYMSGGGKSGWRAEMTVVGFGTGDQARWWLTGVEWGWRERGTDDPGGGRRRFVGEERQQILDLANNEILPPSPASEHDSKTVHNVALVRLSNFLQHLSLSYQLECLYNQALRLSAGKWGNHLSAELDRTAKTLKLKYWNRLRSSPQNTSTGKKSSTSPILVTGATLSILIKDVEVETDESTKILDEIESGNEEAERTSQLRLVLQWEIGEGGSGVDLKAGSLMDTSSLRLDPENLSVEAIVDTASRIHAVYSTNAIASTILSAPRFNLLPGSPSTLETTGDTARPLMLIIPLPSKPISTLNLWVSPLTGLVEIEDSGLDESSTDDRAGRLKLATAGINDGRSKVTDDLTKLIVAILIDNLENQMKQLGWATHRRLPLRSQEMAKADIIPATSVFTPLPTSPNHYLSGRITQQGLLFELLKLVRVQDGAIGAKMVVGDRIPIELDKLRGRRLERDQMAATVSETGKSSFEVDIRDLKDMFVFANALVAQTIVEQQLKNRSIPYTLQYPPPSGQAAALSKSPIAGMIPSIVVQSSNLLKDDRAADVAAPKVYLQIKDWWKAGKCKVVTIVQLRHRPSMDDAVSPSATTGARQSNAAKAEGIAFDQAASVVKFESDDISRCVPAFLEQWERLSKVIVVAGSVNRLKKSERFKDLRMLSFDLRTATFAYASGYIASITYNPSSDSYVAHFGRFGSASSTSPTNVITPRAAIGTGLTPADPMSGLTPAGITPGLTPGAGQTPSIITMAENPHIPMAPLLSHYLNELVGKSKGNVGKDFILLLRSTLPFLLEVESLQANDYPTLVIRSVSRYRLVWDHQDKRYILDAALLSNNTQWIFSDGSTNTDPSCGTLTTIPNLDRAINTASKTCKGCIKLDDGNSLLCDANIVDVVCRVLVSEVGGIIGV